LLLLLLLLLLKFVKVDEVVDLNINPVCLSFCSNVDNVIGIDDDDIGSDEDSVSVDNNFSFCTKMIGVDPNENGGTLLSVVAVSDETDDEVPSEKPNDDTDVPNEKPNDDVVELATPLVDGANENPLEVIAPEELCF